MIHCSFAHCKKRRVSTLPASYGQIVASYIQQQRPGARAERRTFAQESTFEGAVRRAALALTPDGKTHSHQRRVSRRARRAWSHRMLRHVGRLQPSQTFEELFDCTESLSIRGVGEMAIYDTAYRIGAKLGLEPRLVYLHRGTRKGARLLGLGKGRSYLRAEELPVPFRVLRPYEIEDCLCIYKADIARIITGGAN
jgi:hypothetical protein